jgi:tetratricopeptide (TPR) repeat protein
LKNQSRLLFPLLLLWLMAFAIPLRAGNADSLLVEQMVARSMANRKIEVGSVVRDPHLDSAFKLAASAPANAQMVRIFNILGERYRQLSQFGPSLDMHNQALEMARNIDDSLLIGESLNKIGVVFRRIDENQKAMKYHLQALEIAESRHDTRNVCIALNSIGNINLSLRKPEEAIRYFMLCLQYEKQRNNPLGEAINLNNIGAAYLMQDRFGDAIAYIKRSMDKNVSIGSKLGIGICHTSLGDVYKKQGKLDDALREYQTADRIHLSIGDSIYLAETRANLGEVYLLRDQPATARQYLDDALEIAGRINAKSQIMNTYQLLSDYFSKSGEPEKALSYYKKYTSFKDSLDDEANSSLVSELESNYQLQKKEKEISRLDQMNLTQRQKLTNARSIIAIMVVAAVLLGVIGVLVFYQNKLRDKYQLKKVEQQLLLAQMNPHFLFNSLNTIDAYILQNDEFKASAYLNKFSSLIRRTLENSRHTFINISEEIESLRLYCTLEQERFNNQFDFSIEADEDLLFAQPRIPTMVFQPFIENAILHGLRHKTNGKGQLRISFKDVQSKTITIIEDNGIGRKASGVINHHRKQHESVGIRIATERIEKLVLTHHVRGSIHIDDLEAPDGTALGTRITIEIDHHF